MTVEAIMLRLGTVDGVEVSAALVRTERGIVLVDTGLHPVHVLRPEATFGRVGPRVVMAEEDAILKRLAEHGVNPEDVTLVVNTHLHFDHAGNNGAFPNAAFVVQAEHLAWARGPGKREAPGMYWDMKNLAYLPVRGAADVAPGVRVRPLSGHVPGEQAVVIGDLIVIAHAARG